MSLPLPTTQASLPASPVPPNWVDNRHPLGRLIGWLRGFAHTRVIATHDLDLVLALCPRVVMLHRGCIAADGASADLLADAALLATCGLELPLSRQPN